MARLEDSDLGWLVGRGKKDRIELSSEDAEDIERLTAENPRGAMEVLEKGQLMLRDHYGGPTDFEVHSHLR